MRIARRCCRRQKRGVTSLRWPRRIVPDGAGAVAARRGGERRIRGCQQRGRHAPRILQISGRRIRRLLDVNLLQADEPDAGGVAVHARGGSQAHRHGGRFGGRPHRIDDAHCVRREQVRLEGFSESLALEVEPLGIRS